MKPMMLKIRSRISTSKSHIRSNASNRSNKIIKLAPRTRYCELWFDVCIIISKPQTCTDAKQLCSVEWDRSGRCRQSRGSYLAECAW